MEKEIEKVINDYLKNSGVHELSDHDIKQIAIEISKLIDKKV